jgi:uridine nucleosidase
MTRNQRTGTNPASRHTTYNATAVLTAIAKDREIPVYVGAHKPLVRPEMHAPTTIHGESGLDGTSLLPKPATPANRSVPATEAIEAALRKEKPGTVWLVATGTLTNVATLFARHPELAEHIAGLSIMGGAIGGGFTDIVMGVVDGIKRIGNWTPYAEFNILADPEAAAAVFGNPALARKTTLIPLDLTHQVLGTKEVQDMLLFGTGADAKEKMRKGTTTTRMMFVELLLFFAKTYRLVADFPSLSLPY